MRDEVHSLTAGDAVGRVTLSEPSNFVGGGANPIGSEGPEPRWRYSNEAPVAGSTSALAEAGTRKDAPELGLGLAVACVLCDGGGRDCGCESNRWPLGAPSEVAAQGWAPSEV
jgi:hypothetical protein